MVKHEVTGRGAQVMVNFLKPYPPTILDQISGGANEGGEVAHRQPEVVQEGGRKGHKSICKTTSPLLRANPENSAYPGEKGKNVASHRPGCLDSNIKPTVFTKTRRVRPPLRYGYDS